MKIYLATCDHYDHLLKGFSYLFNKYWGEGQEVDVLGFRRPELPDNFKFHQLEERETRAWTTNLRLFFETIEDPYFVFLLDDYWLTEPVNMDDVRLMEEQVRGGAVKGDLSSNTQYFDHTQEGGFVVATPSAQYRTSTQPAIWNRDHLLSLLQKDQNPWQFELQNDAVAARKGRLVGLPRQVYKYANVYYKGKPHHMVDKISPEDKAELIKLGAFDGFKW